jgi:hypothetical protein
MSQWVSKRPNWIAVGVAALALCASVGCTSQMGSGSVMGSASGGDERFSPEALADAKRELDNAKKKLDAVRLRLKQAEADDKAALARLDAERALAEAELKQFDEQDAPNRIAQKRIEAQSVRDQLADDQEELHQLELMYAAEDLADQTKQIVLQRGKRRLVRSQDRLGVEERELAVFEQFTLPRERTKLELELAAKLRALESEKASFAITKLEKEVEISDAEDKVKDVQAHVARIEKHQAKSQEPSAESAKEPGR